MRKILQVFRRKPKVYICDPAKAETCTKEGCWEINKGPCKCTLKKSRARLDANGKRLIASEEDQINLDYLESRISEFDRIVAMDDEKKDEIERVLKIGESGDVEI